MSDPSYSLGIGEFVVRKHSSVKHGGALAQYSSELLLTTRNLVVTHRGALGRVKDVQVFPIDQAAMVGGQVQAVFTKSRAGAAQIDVYLLADHQSFRFEKKRDAADWADAINRVASGQTVSPQDAVNAASVAFLKLVDGSLS